MNSDQELAQQVTADSARVRSSMDNIEPLEPSQPPTLGKSTAGADVTMPDIPTYVYPTVIVLSVVIIAIMVLASTAQTLVKIFVFILAIIAIFALYVRSQGIMQLKYAFTSYRDKAT
ncbi:MAG: hypothetical protein MUO31_05435 [Thermodesulfovibrionales bacterium]|nr:hypothetical protein [Thermodesulfovibrionales bacterium]